MKVPRSLKDVRRSLAHAFAVESESEPLSAEDHALLDRIASALVARRLGSSALLLLESAGPMHFLGSQALHFLKPLLSMVCDEQELERVARVLERRNAVPHLIGLIESKIESQRNPSP